MPDDVTRVPTTYVPRDLYPELYEFIEGLNQEDARLVNKSDTIRKLLVLGLRNETQPIPLTPEAIALRVVELLQQRGFLVEGRKREAEQVARCGLTVEDLNDFMEW